VTSYADIKGKRIATNSPASRAMIDPALAAHGVKGGDVQHRTLNYSEQVSAMKDGSLDVGFFAAAPRNASVMELAATRPIRVLGLDPDRAREFGQAYPYWTPLTLPAGTYPGQTGAVRELHPGGKEFTVEKTKFFVDNQMVPAPFHPGAERYWREKGILK
jgi:TRAP transporter TAXI family solute receptor